MRLSLMNNYYEIEKLYPRSVGLGVDISSGSARLQQQEFDNLLIRKPGSRS